MDRFFLPCLLYLLLCAQCKQVTAPGKDRPGTNRRPVMPARAGEIPVPAGFQRVLADTGSFAAWLRQLPLKKDKTVYLFNDRPKSNQEAQYAVVDKSRSQKDLQQCADVIMRLRAEYLMDAGLYDQVSFTDYAGKTYPWTGGKNRASFARYLDLVFGFCGSASLEKQLRPVADFGSIQPGDVLVQGGFPGHAVLVTDLAENEKGEKVFMLLQGYQPAQDMHILVNPVDKSLGPWYRIPVGTDLYTPEWHFRTSHLRRWP